jgi:CheY-like chemotaxis protein
MARILIIEDEASIMMLLRRIIVGMGHQIVTATEGGAAKQAAEREPRLDLILTDLSMPGTPTGLDLIRALREAKPDSPIVVVSGYTNGDSIDACRALGVSDFLPKPFELGFVRGFVDGILKRHAPARPEESQRT